MLLLPAFALVKAPAGIALIKSPAALACTLTVTVQTLFPAIVAFPIDKLIPLAAATGVPPHVLATAGAIVLIRPAG